MIFLTGFRQGTEESLTGVAGVAMGPIRGRKLPWVSKQWLCRARALLPWAQRLLWEAASHVLKRLALVVLGVRQTDSGLDAKSDPSC